MGVIVDLLSYQSLIVLMLSLSLSGQAEASGPFGEEVQQEARPYLGWHCARSGRMGFPRRPGPCCRHVEEAGDS